MNQMAIACGRAMEDQDAASELACAVEAGRNGFTRAQAELCEDGMLACMDCPFRRNGAQSTPEQVSVFESILWFAVDARMPDGDVTVQLYDKDADEPVWPGYFDGEEWIYVDANRANPSHWAHMPAGPGSVVARVPAAQNEHQAGMPR